MVLQKSLSMEKIKNHINLVSIHIPKTAGTTFRSIFIDNVGVKNFAKVDIYSSGNIKVNDKLFDKNRLPKKITAIHGHCSYSYLEQYFELHKEVKFMTWLRDPVERVISNYYFLNKIIADRLQEEEDENLMIRMGKTLEEFVRWEANQNVMSKFLEGAPLHQFSFIGLQDDFENELARLARVMNWQNIENRKHNVTGQKTGNINPEIINLIKTVNQRDVELYKSVLQQRQLH
jgi:hypothetical protein